MPSRHFPLALGPWVVPTNPSSYTAGGADKPEVLPLGTQGYLVCLREKAAHQGLALFHLYIQVAFTGPHPDPGDLDQLTGKGNFSDPGWGLAGAPSGKGENFQVISK